MKLVSVWFVLFFSCSMIAVPPMHICTASDGRYFDILLNMIGSVHRVNFNELSEIAVYDLGFNQDQRDYLETIEKVKVYEIEKINPDILTPFFARPNNQKPVPGWYSWKPVAIKDTLDRVPYVLWLDAGLTVMKSLNNIWEHILEQGYFFVDSDDWVRLMTKKSILNKFDVYSPKKKWMLEVQGLTTNIMGIRKDMLYDNFVLPVYEMARDITNFEDDGSCPQGFGRLRPEQSIYSLFACELGLQIYKKPRIPVRIKGGRVVPTIISFKTSFGLGDHSTIINSRMSTPHLNYFKSHIRYKN